MCRWHEEYGDVIRWLFGPAASHQEVSVLVSGQVDRLHYTFPISPRVTSSLSILPLHSSLFYCPHLFALRLTFSAILLIPFLHQMNDRCVSDTGSHLSSMRTQRSLKCRCRCFFCLFLLFFFSIFLSAFSSSSRLSGGRCM